MIKTSIQTYWYKINSTHFLAKWTELYIEFVVSAATHLISSVKFPQNMMEVIISFCGVIIASFFFCILFFSSNTVKHPSRITPLERKVKPGSSLVIYCDTSIQAIWYFAGDPLPDNAHPIGKGVLQISSISLNNKGTYECIGKIGETNTYFYATSFVRVLGNLFSNIMLSTLSMPNQIIGNK